ncbi:DUF3108 domain-containing protein [Acuticoccus sp. MNP-M23]|uniref:DUF3108 domain-containing protein n=1 Tax=Acuticoccus sp. MNP-M23 TaxID=3072793 RepID=UPI002816560F|nr:DUF3108 domain-containing protein [Acuticoccus sp. MNP-M23]WMS43635.1 DUF3108 domain-containing protein [Acuticoccus sp. MNP-M23]
MNAISAFSAAIVLIAFTAQGSGGAAAQSGTVKVDATYEISIAGWGLARATLDLSVNNGKYVADLQMRPKGVARIVTAVRTAVGAAGRVRGKAVEPSSYSVRATETDKPVTVDMSMRAGTVTGVKARPPLKERPGRVPVTSAHKRGIVDPLSAGLFPISRPDARDACNRTLKIYDGWTRYDVKLRYKGQRNVSTEGFKGSVAVCAARWVPVAGHRPRKPEVEYLRKNKDLEVTMVPVGNGLAIPYSVAIGTPNGRIAIEPSSMRISPNGV